MPFWGAEGADPERASPGDSANYCTAPIGPWRCCNRHMISQGLTRRQSFVLASTFGIGRRCRAAVVLAALACAAFPAAALSDTPVGNSQRATFAENRGGSDHTVAAGGAALAHDPASGRTLLTYLANVNQARRYDVHGVFVTPRGSQVGRPFFVSQGVGPCTFVENGCGTRSSQRPLLTEYNPVSGEYIAVWVRGPHLAAQRISSDGPVGPTIQVSDDSARPFQGAFDFTIDEQGNWLVAWRSIRAVGDMNQLGLAVSQFAPDGDRLSGPTLLPTAATLSYDTGISVGADSGGYLLAFTGRSEANEYLEGKVITRRLDLTGVPVGAERDAAGMPGLATSADLVRTSAGYMLLARLGLSPDYNDPDNPSGDDSRLWTRPLSVDGEPLGEQHPLTRPGAKARGTLVEGSSPHALIANGSGLYVVELRAIGRTSGRAQLLSGDRTTRGRTYTQRGDAVYLPGFHQFLPGPDQFLSAFEANYPDRAPRPGRYDQEVFTRPFVAGGFPCDGRQVTMLGTPRADILLGNARRDAIWAGRGRDRIRGAAGSDTMCGAAGADRIFGGLGRDHLNGMRGADLLVGGKGRDRLIGGGGLNTLIP